MATIVSILGLLILTGYLRCSCTRVPMRYPGRPLPDRPGYLTSTRIHNTIVIIVRNENKHVVLKQTLLQCSAIFIFHYTPTFFRQFRGTLQVQTCKYMYVGSAYSPESSERISREEEP